MLSSGWLEGCVLCFSFPGDSLISTGDFLVRLCHAHSQCRLLAFSVVVNVKCRRSHEWCSQTLGVQSTQLLQKVALHVLLRFLFLWLFLLFVTIIAVCDSTLIGALQRFH